MPSFPPTRKSRPHNRHSRVGGNLARPSCRHSCVGGNPFGAQAPQTGLRPVSPIPRGHVIPAKAGTYPVPPTAVPSPAAFAASSPLLGRGGIRHSRVGRNPFGAQAPQTGRSPVSNDPPGPRHSRESGNLPQAPDRSTLSRRVRGVLSPSRERGIRHSRVGGNLAPLDGGATRPVSPIPQAPRHSRESGNLLEAPRPPREEEPTPRPPRTPPPIPAIRPLTRRAPSA